MPETNATEPAVLAPPERFNFAQHLLACNAARPAKAAFIDDKGRLSYGALDERVRRMAAGLRAIGLRREERVLLLMHDCNDWPVSFLGALYAGLVPVAVNTLLTADDYAYMLENSRAQAVLVSGALLPTLASALTRAQHEVGKVIVSRTQASLQPRQTTPASGSIPQAPPAGPKARCIRTSTRTGRPSCTAKACCGCARVTSASPPPNSSSPMAWAKRSAFL